MNRNNLHPICRLMRDRRHAAGLSLGDVQRVYGIPAVVLGSYERGDRRPPLVMVDRILAIYGYRLTVVPDNGTPTAADLANQLRTIADQLDRDAGRDERPGADAVPSAGCVR